MENLKFKIMMKESHSIIIQSLGDDNKYEEMSCQDLHIYEERDEDIQDVVLKIEIDGYFNIYYHYGVYKTGLQDFTVYINGNVIFLGGKSKSCTVDMLTNMVENEFKHCLFWDFEELDNGLIFEQGEIDCLLRKASGEIIDTAYVEPPYEVFYETDRIRFEFDSVIENGRTYLSLK